MNQDKIHLGIDASNISSGGGLTHLVHLLSAADAAVSAVNRVTVWTGKETAKQLPSKPWLSVHTPEWCEGSLLRRAWGQQMSMPGLLRAAGCDVLFSPGGTLPWRSPVPMVTLSQNMLPFEPLSAKLFGRWSRMRLKMGMLRLTQGRSFLRAHGLIFLTEYARKAIKQSLGIAGGMSALIPHGIEGRFLQAPRPQRSFEEFSDRNPFKVLYVSILMPYKHQIEVALAVCNLRKQGFPLEARFVGAPWGNYADRFQETLNKLDPESIFLKYAGHEPFEKLHDAYCVADAFLFASSCENLPNILIEAMAAGLPIACSMRGPMPEVLGDAGVYFDPLEPDSIGNALLNLAQDRALRTRLADLAWTRAQAYSWEKCAYDTFKFVENVVKFHQGKSDV